MKLNIDDLTLLRIALFFSILGSGITWTGLGYELAITYNNPGLMGIMQIISTSASIVGPLIIAFLSWKISAKSILINSDIVSSTCYFVLFLLIINSTFHIYNFSISILLIFTSMLFGSIQTIYFEPLYASYVKAQNDSKKNLTREFAQLGSYITFGKLLGMGMGPVVFAALHYYALIFNVFTFLLSAFIFYFVLIVKKRRAKVEIAEFSELPASSDFLSISDEEEKKPECKGIFKRFEFKYIFDSVFLEGSIASSLIFIVVVFLSIKIIALQPSASEMSLFWISATICALVSQLVISKSVRIHEFLEDIDKKFGFLFCVPILASLFLNNVFALIICQMLFSFLNPISRNSARANFFKRFGDNERASNAYAMREFVTQIIILVFGVIATFLYSNVVFILGALIITILICLRWFFSRQQVSFVQTK